MRHDPNRLSSYCSHNPDVNNDRPLAIVVDNFVANRVVQIDVQLSSTIDDLVSVAVMMMMRRSIDQSMNLSIVDDDDL